MGAGADDEIVRLRARAYGPDADIAADPAAVARLLELEAERGARKAGSTPRRNDSAGSVELQSVAPAARRGPAALPGDSRATGRGRPGERPGRGRPGERPERVRRLAVVVVAAVGIVLGAVAAVRAGAATAPVVVAQISGDPGSTRFAVDGALAEPPLFPIAEDMQFSAPIGQVLGWDVWIGRSRSNFACLALVRSSTVRADCVAPSDFTGSGVTIFLPPSAVAADIRPVELVGGAAVAYQWLPDRTVTVEIRR